MRFACLALVAVVACTDAATTIANRCGQNNPPLDPSAPGLVVRVSVDVATTTGSAAGFCVRAERSDGTAFEALTDASGTATVPIDPAAGPWDVTAARFGYEAVSILNVDGPIAGALFTELVGSGIGGNVLDYWGVDERNAHTLAVHPPSGEASLQDWSVFDQNVPLSFYSASNGGYVFMEFFETSPSAPPFQLTAFSPSVGFFTLPSLARADQDMTVTLDQPSAPAPAKIVTDVDVEMPWPVTVNGLDAGYPVLRPCGPGAQHCRTPGLGTLSFLQTPATKMPWHIESLAAPLDGDSAVASFTGTLGNGSFVSLSLTTRTLGAPSTITVPDFQTTRIDGQHYADTRITTQADAYDKVVATFLSSPPPSFQTCPSCPIPDVVVWRVFTYRGATLTSRALPSLPAGMQISDLRGGGVFSDFIMGGSVSVMAGTDDSHPPWSSATFDGVATIIASR